MVNNKSVEEIKLVAGIDISYLVGSDKVAAVSLVVLSLPSLEVCKYLSP